MRTKDGRRAVRAWAERPILLPQVPSQVPFQVPLQVPLPLQLQPQDRSQEASRTRCWTRRHESELACQGTGARCDVAAVALGSRACKVCQSGSAPLLLRREVGQSCSCGGEEAGSVGGRGVRRRGKTRQILARRESELRPWACAGGVQARSCWCWWRWRWRRSGRGAARWHVARPGLQRETVAERTDAKGKLMCLGGAGKAKQGCPEGTRRGAGKQGAEIRQRQRRRRRWRWRRK